jgi:hypothetical protein
MVFLIAVILAVLADALLIAARGLALGVHNEPTLVQATVGCLLGCGGVQMWVFALTRVSRTRAKNLGIVIIATLLFPVLLLYLITLWDSVLHGVWTTFEIPFFAALIIVCYVNTHILLSGRRRIERQPL